MAANQLIAPLADMTLDAGCTVTWEAIDPATGAAVTGVAITGATVRAVNFVDEDTPAASDVLPVFVPIPATDDVTEAAA